LCIQDYPDVLFLEVNVDKLKDVVSVSKEGKKAHHH
jgi:hypothetical protein